jgi:hypothetical protein
VSAGAWCFGFDADRSAKRVDHAREFVPQGQMLEIARGARHLDVIVHVRHGQYIRGRVQESNGAAPWAFAVMTGPSATMDCPIFRNSNELASGYYARNGRDGSFEHGPLPPGDYELTARAYRGRSSVKPVAVRVKAKAGDENVILRMGKPATASGRVIDARTRAGVVAIVVNAGQAHSDVVSTHSGEFALDYVVSGSLTLVATTLDGRIGILRDVDVEIGRDVSGLEIAVSRGAKLRLHYDGPKDECAVNVLAEGVVVARTKVKKDQVVHVVVPSGEVLVHVPIKLRDESVEQKVDVNAGEVRDVLVKDE